MNIEVVLIVLLVGLWIWREIFLRGELQKTRLRDGLTGVFNRRYLKSFLSKEIPRIHRTHEDAAHKNLPAPAQQMVFLLLDVEGFSRINESIGHAAGDAVLREISQLLCRVSREQDVVVRWSGAQFLIVCRDVTFATAEKIAGRLCAEVTTHVFHLKNGQAIDCTASIGLAPYPFFARAPDRMTWEQVVSLSARCLRAAKKSGRSLWVGLRGNQAPDDAPFVLLRDHTQKAIEQQVVEMVASRGAEIQW